MSCVSRLSCLGLPAFCVVVKPRGSQVSPIFEPWVPLAFFQKEFDVSEITGGKLSPSHDRSAQGRIRSYGEAPHGPPEEAAHLTLYLLPATTVPYLASRGV